MQVALRIDSAIDGGATALDGLYVQTVEPVLACAVLVRDALIFRDVATLEDARARVTYLKLSVVPVLEGVDEPGLRT